MDFKGFDGLHECGVIRVLKHLDLIFWESKAGLLYKFLHVLAIFKRALFESTFERAFLVLVLVQVGEVDDQSRSILSFVIISPSEVVWE